MIIDYNYKDKNKDFSKKADYVTGYPDFVRSFAKNRYNMKNPAIAEKDNPFTMIGLLTAIINDLNDLRQKVKVLEMHRISQNADKFIVKEVNSKND